MKIAYETTRLYAPLGIRFWDAATDSQVHDGLAVRAWPADSPELVAEAFLTRSDIYAFRDLPGPSRLRGTQPVRRPNRPQMPQVHPNPAWKTASWESC